MSGLRIINCAEKIDSGNRWNFLEDRLGELEYDWEFFINFPNNWLERRITKPQISRFRACLQTALSAKYGQGDCIIISHLPRATCWVAIFAKLLNVHIPHLAFSFNFTDLPTGKMRKIMSYSFQSVDRFVVYSNVEKLLYSEYFNLDKDRFDVLPWAMEKPQYWPSEPLVHGDYISAVGSEGRDYASLSRAMRHLPEIPLVIVARPYNLDGLDFPPNVKVFTDLPAKKFWNVVKFSRFSVLPLKDTTTNCSHISIVGSMMFGKPIVATISQGTEDYIIPERNSLVSLPRDIEGLAANINSLWSNPSLCSQLGNESQMMAQSKHDLDSWVRYLTKYLQQIPS